MTGSSTTRSLGSPLTSKSSKIPLFREMTCTRAVPCIQDPESHRIPSQSPHQRVNRSLRSPSQRASSCGPVALAAGLRNSPLVQRNRDLFLSPLLYLNQRWRKQDLFLLRSLRCRMAMRVPHQQARHARRRRRLLHRKHLLHRRRNRRSLPTRRCMTLRVRVLAS
jgi:hypothetical protein